MVIHFNNIENQFEASTAQGLYQLETFRSDCKWYLSHFEGSYSGLNDETLEAFFVAVLSELGRKGMEIVPLCEESVLFFNNHPEWHYLLSEGYQM